MMNQVEALAKAKELLGSHARVEYDAKMTTLTCWIYRVSDKGWISGMWGGRTWEDAFKETRNATKERVHSGF